MNKVPTIYAAVIVIGFAGLAMAAESTNAVGEGNGYRKQCKEQRQEFRKEQKAENEAFRASLSNMTAEARQAAMAKHREEQYAERKAFCEKMHQDNLKYLNEKLASSKMTDEQKAEVIKFFEEQYGENVAFREAQHDKAVKFFSEVSADESLTPEQRKAKIKEYTAGLKEEAKTHHEAQKAERKQMREQKRAARKAAGEAGTESNEGGGKQE